MSFVSANQLKLLIENSFSSQQAGQAPGHEKSIELAMLDVREPGQFGEGHLLFAIPVPFSTFECKLRTLVYKADTRTVLIDAGDGVAERAASVAQKLGYSNVSCLAGGVDAWVDAGHMLYQGVNVPSKVFGELLEHARQTPSVTADELLLMRQRGESVRVIDGRPLSEFDRMCIPGAECCPNGELAIRIEDKPDDRLTTLIINCAGRTRSILGAQTLIDAGTENRVLALENGTQGWVLAGQSIERGNTGKLPPISDESVLSRRRQRCCDLAAGVGVATISVEQLEDQILSGRSTVYLLDVRSHDEFAQAHVPGSVHAPAGQLVQATDQWIGVRAAHLVLLDDETVRAPMCAYWLAQLGHKVSFLEGNPVSDLLAEGKSFNLLDKKIQPVCNDTVKSISAASINEQGIDSFQLIDIRSSADYRLGHLQSASWLVRPRLDSFKLSGLPIVVIGDRAGVFCLRQDLLDQPVECFHLQGCSSDWSAAGLDVVTSDDEPADSDRIDHLFFTAERHQGNREHSLQYLNWEIALVDQLQHWERAAFQLKQD